MRCCIEVCLLSEVAHVTQQIMQHSKDGTTDDCVQCTMQCELMVCTLPCIGTQETAPGNGISPLQWRTQAHSAYAHTVTAAQDLAAGSDLVDLFARRWFNVALPRLQIEMREVRALCLFLAR